MEKTYKCRIVIDTNLLISAVIAGGTPYNLLQAWKDEKYILLFAPQLLQEIIDTSRKDYLQKYHLFPEKVTELMLALKLGGELVNPSSLEFLPIHCRDRKDDILLAVAFEGNADYLITGDKDLLVLNGKKELGKLKIITAKEFLTLL